MTGEGIQPGATTRLFVLLGDPVHHSRSPALQNTALRAVGIDAVYLALRCGQRDLVGLLRGIARAGGGGNVTVPWKARAVAALDEPGPAVERTGACNTFWGVDGVVHGDNTDVEGFRRALRAWRGPEWGSSALVMGAGGAAAAVVAGLLDLGASEVVIANRSPARATELARRFASESGAARIRAVPSAADEGGRPYDLVINATSLGLRPRDPSPVPDGVIRSAGGVMDLVYGRDTALLRQARGARVPALDGTSMLVEQGAAAFERWFARPAPRDAMQAAVVADPGP